MAVCESDLTLNFEQPRPVVVKFSELDLSSDAGILLAHQAEQVMQICQGIAECIPEWRDPTRIVHSLPQLVIGVWTNAIDAPPVCACSNRVLRVKSVNLRSLFGIRGARVAFFDQREAGASGLSLS